MVVKLKNIMCGKMEITLSPTLERIDGSASMTTARHLSAFVRTAIAVSHNTKRICNNGRMLLQKHRLGRC